MFEVCHPFKGLSWLLGGVLERADSSTDESAELDDELASAKDFQSMKKLSGFEGSLSASWFWVAGEFGMEEAPLSDAVSEVADDADDEDMLFAGGGARRPFVEGLLVDMESVINDELAVDESSHHFPIM